MKYYIVKNTRSFQGISYMGPSFGLAGLRGKKEYDNLTEALDVATELSAVNPVGFSVYDENGLRYIQEKD